MTTDPYRHGTGKLCWPVLARKEYVTRNCGHFKNPFATNALVSSTNQIRSSTCSAQLNWHLTDPNECFGK